MRKLAHMTTATNIPGVVPTFDLGDRLTKARKVAGLSQGEIADAIDISRRSVSAYELGDSEPKRHVVLAWAMATGVDGFWLLTGETPDPDGPGVSVFVRHQGLEPRTRWLVVAGEPDLGVSDIRRTAA